MKRRAGSPIIAEFVLLVLAIVVAVPLGSFVFALMGSNTNRAEVTVGSSSCSQAGQQETACNFTLTNLGAANSQFQPYALIMVINGNQTKTDSSTACQGMGGNTIPAGGSLQVTCLFDVSPGSSGAQYSGWLSVLNIGWIPFAGRFA